jgi:hypothetical protein
VASVIVGLPDDLSAEQRLDGLGAMGGLRHPQDLTDTVLFRAHSISHESLNSQIASRPDARNDGTFAVQTGQAAGGVHDDGMSFD